MNQKSTTAIVSDCGNLIIAYNTPYSSKEFFNSLNAKWSMKFKSWELPYTPENSIKIVSSGIFESIDEQINKQANEFQNILTNKKESQIKSLRTSYKHQLEWVKLIKKLNKCLFLGGVGTGKTKAAIESAIQFNATKILVVVPAPVMANFANQVKVHSTFSSVILKGTKTQRLEKLNDTTKNIYIINYDVLAMFELELISKKFEMVIFDEIHYLKNSDSKRSKSALKIAQFIPLRLGLTGTLTANGLEQAFHPAKVIDSQYFGTNEYSFKAKYMIFQRHVFGSKKFQKHVGYKNREDFKERLAKFSLTYTIDDVTDIPPATTSPIMIEPSKQLLLEYSKQIEYRQDNPSMSAIEFANNLQKICSNDESKVESLKHELEQLNGSKCVIWYKFTDTGLNLFKSLSDCGYQVSIYNGFNRDGLDEFKRENNQILISQMSMGIGWEIPECQFSFFYEFTSSKTENDQAKGRTRRLESDHAQKPVFYYYFLVNKTLDERIFNVIQKRNALNDDIEQFLKEYQKERGDRLQTD